MFELSQIYTVFALISLFKQCHLTVAIHQMNVVKRMDIATCLGNTNFIIIICFGAKIFYSISLHFVSFRFVLSAKFDVKSDMIIKTAESRKLGGKFLDSADALTKTECLHLCCETESCDVFVFEEKVGGFK